MKYTVVVPCYNEEEYIESLYLQVKKVMEPLNDFEILFVDDGSTDKTLERIKAARLKDRRVKFVSLVTNYGHQKAIYAGLQLCRYEFAITMDVDLQHPPELIPALIEEQRHTEAHIVAGRRKGTQKGLFKNHFSNAFYQVFAWSTGISIEPGVSDFRLYTRKALDIVCNINEREPFLRGMISNLRLKTSIIDYDLQERSQGAPSYTFMKSFRMALTALLRFSSFPIRAGLVLGTAGILLSLGQSVHYLYLRLFTGYLVPGQADLMITLCLISSMILILLSLLLHMNMQIMDSQRGQPVYVIGEKCIDD